ncbi:hypothetical protein IV38_GL000799 [Lactobacillus selangorensis]|uniref:ROK family protein n=1 Tax=Lactobacillus selangorensis TaxID=81857 RepID=A0A0R2FJ19_9LACO|nr:ROK family protein [Lactobacillus selangorensis]KRN28600.1 hypothetical protein IV38_GL000799 [Lactobacillus selangorensis]KRN32990.1 hypothetical protein IV40_GL001054 [Lactobacillus selangorensis]
MNAQTVLGVDLGGTKLLIGEVTANGQVVAQQKMPSDITNQRIATQLILDAIAAYLQQRQNDNQIVAIAVDVVDRVNNATGVWEDIVPGVNQEPIPLAQLVTERFHLPCFVGNDVMAGTVAENKLGIGRVEKNFVYIAIGTGLAGRLVIDGKLLNGEDYNAGEFGHMVVDQNSTVQCVCGRYGCVEPLASGLGMSNRAHDLYPQYQAETKLLITPDERIGADVLFNGYDAGDPLARAVVTQALQALSNLIMNLTQIANPKAFRLGGVTTGGWLVDHLQPYLQPTTMRFVTGGVKNTTLNPNTVALQGCALYGFERLAA